MPELCACAHIGNRVGGAHVERSQLRLQSFQLRLETDGLRLMSRSCQQRGLVQREHRNTIPTLSLM